MSEQPAVGKPTFDPYDYVGMVCNPDGSVTRKSPLDPNHPSPALTGGVPLYKHLLPFTVATADLNQSSPVLTKDLPLNQSKGTWFRIFLPRQALDHHSAPTKLPLVAYFHAGSFILGSAGSTVFHDFCTIVALESLSVVVSVDYRLAPENRLPAAYDDCVEALQWIKTNQDEWLRSFADFSNCFLMGSSAGANIVYNAGLRLIAAVDDLEPPVIRGLILHQPFIGGSKKTESETRLADEKALVPPSVTELTWELALPVGADRDHEYCNPTVGGGTSSFDQIVRLGWKVLVTGCEGDPLIDRQIQLAKMLEEKDVDVVRRFREGGHHGLELFDSSEAKSLCPFVKRFRFTTALITKLLVAFALQFE